MRLFFQLMTANAQFQLKNDFAVIPALPQAPSANPSTIDPNHEKLLETVKFGDLTVIALTFSPVKEH